MQSAYEVNFLYRLTTGRSGWAAPRPLISRREALMLPGCPELRHNEE